MRYAAIALVLAACSGSGNGVPDAPPPQCTPGAVLACPGGWATCSSEGHLGGCVLTASPSDAGPELDADANVAADVADACTAPPASSQVLGLDCVPDPRPCACASGQRYVCTAPDYRSQPSTSVVLGGKGVPGGCVTVSDAVTTTDAGAWYTTEHCCAAACVRHASADATCEPGHPSAYACAAGAAVPFGCVAVGSGYCCGE